MPSLYVTVLLAMQTASAGSPECAILDAALTSDTVARERELESGIAVWGTPDWPAQLSESDPVWQCPLPDDMRWERQSPDGFTGDSRSLTIRAEWPLIAGDTATVTLHYVHWAPSEDTGWVSEEVFLLERVDGRWTITARRWALHAD